MKASRAAIKTAKSVAELVEQMAAMDARMAKLEKALRKLAAKVTAVDKPPESTTSQEKAQAAQKQGGGA